MVFKKLEHQNKSEYVYKQIVSAIKAGEFKPGDKLPVETEIAALSGVSRASVREALSALRLAGIVETKKGTGTYIKSLETGENLVNGVFDSAINAFEILEARMAIEPSIAKLAMSVMDDNSEQQIEDELIKMEKAAEDNDVYTFHMLNGKFHLAIVMATKNASLISYIGSLLNVFAVNKLGKATIDRYLTEEGYIQEAIKIHREIFDALKSRDPKRLEQAWDIHDQVTMEQLRGE